MRVAPIALAACLLATLPVASATAPPDVSGWLQPVVERSYDATDDAYRGMLLNAMVDREAYASATVLAGEAAGRQQDDLAWEAAQAKADYVGAYRQDAHRRLGTAVLEAQAAANRLADVAEGGIARADAGRLLLAARLLVEADAALEDASYAYTGMLSATTITPIQRLGFGRGVGIGSVASGAAIAILDGFTPSGGAPVDLDLALSNAARYDRGVGEVVQDAGPLFAIAKATRTWESRYRGAPNETLADIRTALAESGRYRQLLTDNGLGTQRFDSVMHDAEAWAAEGDVHYTEPAWIPLVAVVYSQVRGAQFEAEALTLEPTPDSGGRMVWIAAIAAAAAAALAIAAWRRRRMQANGLLALLMVAAAVHALPDASAAPAIDPEAAAVPVPEGTAVAAMGNLVRLDDGRLQFAWSQQEDGKFVLMERKYDPAARTWTEPTELFSDEENSNTPRLVKAGSQLHLFWMHGYEGASSTGPVQVWWCLVGPSGCTGARAVTDPSLRVLQFVPSAAPNGDVWIAYAEWSDHLGAQVAKVQVRARIGGAWKDPVLLADDSLSQTAPTLAATDSGAHVVWQQVPEGGHPSQPNSQLRHLFVPASGQAGSSQRVLEVQPRSGGLAVHVRGDLLTILFDQGSGPQRPVNLYETHRVGNGPFSAPANVSRGLLNPLWPTLQDGPDGLIAVWSESDTVDGFVARAAIQRGGAWSRPIRLSAEGLMATVPSFTVEDSGKMNVVWSGSSPALKATQLHFRRLMPVWPSLPPTIVGTDPDGSKWVGGEPVELRVHVVADWPLDAQGSTVVVDGTPAAVQVTPDGLVAKASLGDGPHEAVATVRDRNGGTATTTWAFSVDRSPPEFTWRIEAADGTPAPAGWSTAPLKVIGQLTPDAGAPSRLEVQVDGGTWYTLPAAGAPLNEGRMADIRVRAVDDAANVRLGAVLEAGWDATPPQVVFDGDGGWQGSTDVSVAFRDNATAGSPVTIQVRLLRGSEVLATQTVTGTPGVAKFPGVPEGRYIVESTAEDAAGHDGGSSTWEVGVDRTLPRVRLTSLANGSVQVDAEDAGSGVARVELRRGSAVVETFEGGGLATLQLAIQVPSGTDVAVVDQAGHEALARSTGSGFVVDDGAYDVGPRGGGEKGMPGPGLLILALGLLLASRSRR